MVSVFELFDPRQQPGIPRAESDILDVWRRNMDGSRQEIDAMAHTGDIQTTAATRHGRRILDVHSQRTRDLIEAIGGLMAGLRRHQETGQLGDSWLQYQRDAAERLVLATDTLRKRGDIFLEHEAAGCPPVLVYDYELVMDGRDLPHPCNYMLLHILPPEGVTVDDNRRPYIIIDPRAGHGPGIGGFKSF